MVMYLHIFIDFFYYEEIAFKKSHIRKKYISIVFAYV